MDQEPKAVRILKAIVIATVMIMIPAAFFIESSIRLEIGHDSFRLRPFELMFLAIPMVALLLAYECIRGVAMWVKKRRSTAALDEAFVARLAAKSSHRGKSTDPG